MNDPRHASFWDMLPEVIRSKPELLSRLVTAFLKQLDSSAASIRAASALDDAVTVAYEAHRVKGAAGMIGLRALSEVAAHLETTAKAAAGAGAFGPVRTAIVDFARIATQVALELSAGLPEASSALQVANPG